MILLLFVVVVVSSVFCIVCFVRRLEGRLNMKEYKHNVFTGVTYYYYCYYFDLVLVPPAFIFQSNNNDIVKQQFIQFC